MAGVGKFIAMLRRISAPEGEAGVHFRFDQFAHRDETKRLFRF
jgi:hypothetical protein